MIKQAYKILKRVIVVFIRCFSLGQPRGLPLHNQTAVRRILVLLLDYLGDTLFSTPLLHALRTHYPTSYITVCVRAEAMEIADTNPYINEVITFDKHKVLQERAYSSPYKLYLKEKLVFLHQLRLRKFDLVIDCSGIISTNLLAFLSGAQWVAGFADKGLGFLLHQPVLEQKEQIPYIDRTNKILNNLHINPINSKPDYFIPLGARKFANKLLEKNKIPSDALVVGIHPTAGWEAKCWQAQKFAHLVNLMVEAYDAKIIIFGASADIKTIKKIEPIVTTGMLIVAGKTTLHRTAALIEKCKLVIANDSIVLHIAQALNVPTVGIYGPTNPNFSTIKNEKHRVVSKRLPCSPNNGEYCLKNASINGECKSMDCMRLLTIEDVWQVAKEQLDSCRGSIY